MKSKRAKRATVQTPPVTDDEPTVAHFAGCHLGFFRILGFRSAPPQALRYRPAPRAKKIPRCTTTHGGTLENPQNQSTASVRLSEQMRTELLWTTVIFRSINDLQTPPQLELEHIEAKR